MRLKIPSCPDETGVPVGGMKIVFGYSKGRGGVDKLNPFSSGFGDNAGVGDFVFSFSCCEENNIAFFQFAFCYFFAGLALCIGGSGKLDAYASKGQVEER
ncbi:hypothetical protein GCM10028791_39230 [Echinicola sediminis]